MKVNSHPNEPTKVLSSSAMFPRMPAALQMTGLKRSTIYRLISEKKFPVPVRLGARAVAGRQTDLETWSEARELSMH